MKKKVLIYLLLGAIICLPLFGCQSTGDNSKPSSDSATLAPADENATTADNQTEEDIIMEEVKVKDVVVATDFSKRVGPPLVKKFSMFNSGLVPIKNYDRDFKVIEDLYCDSLRIDTGIGAKDFALCDVVGGTKDNITYDFEKIDYLSKMFNDLKVLPYYSWTYIPKPLQDSGDHRRGPTDLDKYGKILEDFARHFREAGIRIGYHEIYNEPDLENVFYAGTFAEYMELYKIGSLAIKAGDPDAVIGGPALASPENVQNTNAFLDMVVREKLPLDFFSYHHYWLNGGYDQKYRIVKQALSKYDEFKTTEIHLNEIAYVNGWLPGEDSINNFYEVAPHVFKMLNEMLAAPDITVVSWAQFLESTVVGDAYGIIYRDGTKKAIYNAFKIYADMPVARAELQTSNPAIDGMVSYEDNKAAILLYNTGIETYNLKTTLEGLPFKPEEGRLYRIDKNNASFFNGAKEDLEICESWDMHDGKIPDIVIEPGATVYITLVGDKGIKDFDPKSRYVDFPEDIRLHYYFEDRDKNNYSFIDRKSWRIDLGMGENVSAYSVAGVTFKELPEIMHVSTKTYGNLNFSNENAYLGVRIDFFDGKDYTYSVAFCPEDFANREKTLRWGTKKKVDKIVVVGDFKEFDVNISEYIPDNASSQRAIVTFEMENTGTETCAEFHINKK